MKQKADWKRALLGIENLEKEIDLQRKDGWNVTVLRRPFFLRRFWWLRRVRRFRARGFLYDACRPDYRIGELEGLLAELRSPQELEKGGYWIDETILLARMEFWGIWLAI